MPIIEITSLSHPGVEVFGTLTEAQLRNRLEPDKGLFIAESPKVIRVALDAGYEPLDCSANENISTATLPTSSPDAPTYPSTPARVSCLPS